MTKKITALNAQKRNKYRVNVYLDGKFAFGLTGVVVGSLVMGQELTREEIEDLKIKDASEMAYHRALNFLSYRARSEEEVRKNLRKHKTPEETIEEIIPRLREKKFLNDEEFAVAWVENRSEFRPRGRRALYMELRQKGITQEIIDNTLEDLEEGPLAYQAAIKQSRKLKGLEKNDFRKKLSGFLARRGFSYGLIFETIATVWNELSNPEEDFETSEVN